MKTFDGTRWNQNTNDTINVKDFGAKGDGITDDTIPIRDCINYANQSETKTTVLFPPGTYWIPRGTSMVFTNQGDGQFARRMFDVGSNVHIMGYGATITHDGDYPWRKILFYIEGSHVIIEGLTFTNIYDMAGGSRPTDIPIAGGSAYDVDAPTMEDISIIRCTFNRSWHPTKFGISVDNGVTISKVVITECVTNGEPTSTSSGGYNFASKPPGRIHDIVISGNKVYDMSVSAAIGLYGAHKATVTGNICRGSGLAGAGIQLENGADSVTITGNVLEDHYNHVWVDDSTNVTITGNTAMNKQANSSYKGIRITYQGHAFDYNQKVTNIVASNNNLTQCRIIAEQFSTIEVGSSPSIGDVSINNNQIHLDGVTYPYGISTAPGDSYNITNNLIVGASQVSILVTTSNKAPSQSTVVMGNITKKKDTENSVGFRIDGTYGPGPIVEGNRFTNSITYSRFLYNTIGHTYIITGQGDPVGNLAASRGSVYFRTDGQSGSEVMYVKNGDGLTGWVAK